MIRNASEPVQTVLPVVVQTGCHQNIASVAAVSGDALVYEVLEAIVADRCRYSYCSEYGSQMGPSEALLDAMKLGKILFPYELAGGMGKTREIFSKLHNEKHIGLFIGPEGGFADEEVRSAMDAGANVITLGKRILRTETAGLYVLSVLGYLFEE